MKGPGILWMLQTAAGLSMAGPMFVIGLSHLYSGQYLSGTGFFVLGAIALYLPTYFINRIGGPRAWIRRRLGGSESGGSAASTESDSTVGADADSEPNPDSDRSSLLNRVRRR